MYKIAVMGDYDSIYGFATLGLDTFSATGDHEADAKTLRRLADSGYGSIYMTEALAETLQKEIARFAGSMTPAVILIPGVQGDTGRGVASVKKSVEQAVGSDILFGNQ